MCMSVARKTLAKSIFEEYILSFDNQGPKSKREKFDAGDPVLGAKQFAEYFHIPARQLTSQA